MKLKGRKQSKNVVDLRSDPMKSLIHDTETSMGLTSTKPNKTKKGSAMVDSGLRAIRRKSAVKQTRGPAPEALIRKQRNKKQDRLK